MRFATRRADVAAAALLMHPAYAAALLNVRRITAAISEDTAGRWKHTAGAHRICVGNGQRVPAMTRSADSY